MMAKPPFWNPWLWPFLATTWAGQAALQTLEQAFPVPPAEPVGPEPSWSMPHEIRLDLTALRVREFSSGSGASPTLVMAPFALHGATLTDFAPGHSIVERLLGEGLPGLCVVECKSATAPMRFLSIDNYLADLAVAVEDLGRPVTLIGLCQGGWLSLMFAARFPDTVCSIVLVGSPVDLEAFPSKLAASTRATQPSAFEALVRSGNGLALGRHVQELWGKPQLDPTSIRQVLQIEGGTPEMLCERYRQWQRWTVDLPGTFYLEVAERLFRRNELARGDFKALGRTIDLSRIKAPLFLLAGRDDDVVPPPQLFSACRLVGTPSHLISAETARCGHLSLFMGTRTLRHEWGRIGRHVLRMRG